MAQLPQSRRTWILGGAAGGVLIIALGWLGLIGPELSSTGSLKSQTSDAQTQNFLLRSKVTSLQAQDKKLPVLKAQLAELQRQLPADSGMPTYIKQVMEQADAAGVTLTSVTAAAPSAASLSGAAPAGQLTTSPAGHLFSIAVNIVGNGSLTQQRALLKAIQNDGPRRALLTSVAFGPSDDSGSEATVQSIDQSDVMTVQLQVFVAPQTPAAEAALKQQIAGS